MYKNTFDRCITSLESEGYSPKDLIKLVSLYDEPIDLYSMSKLTKVGISDVEYMAKVLAKRLVLEKQGEFYELNEFANSFIFIKLMPNRLEIKKIISRIKTYKNQLQEQLTRLEDRKTQNPTLRNMMDDWKPRNHIDTIAIAEVYHLFQKALTAIEKQDMKAVQKIVNDFKNNERITSHPYIRFQKARIYSRFLSLRNKSHREKLIPIICRSYEDAIEGIEFSYSFIKNTKSHGSILWIYGLFLKQELNNLERSTKYLEDARDVLAKIESAKKIYYSVLSTLTFNYHNLFRKTNDRAYKHRCIANHWKITKNSQDSIDSGFRFEPYMKSYSQKVGNGMQKKLKGS